MWCTRWFLPLVILPLPTAPPYFLAVFLISMFLHARPCFYCLMLLTALFTSSCYWQAVPMDALLTRPLGNTTTFGEALRANLSVPNVNAVELPPVVQLLDRCWCNVFSKSGFFELTDVSAWELASVEQARRQIEASAARQIESGKETNEGMADATNDRREDTEARVGEGASESDSSNSPFSLRALRDLLFPTISPAQTTSKYRLKPASSSSTPTSLTTTSVKSRPIQSSSDTPISKVSQEPSGANKDSQVANAAPLMTESAKLLRPYYDLRPYGLDITLDFRWNRE